MQIQAKGTDFIPAHPIELISTYQNIPTLLSCYQKCNFYPLCRTLVSDTSSPFTCRLYQGSIDTGTIISSLSSTSQVAGIHHYPSLYITYDQPCRLQSSLSDRYLICNNGKWQCPTGTYWDGSMCLNAVYYRASCNTDVECRKDVSLSCSSSCHKCVCQSKATWNWNTSTCMSSKCAELIPTDTSVAALLTMNGDASDLMNKYNGTIVGNVSFVPGYVGQAAAFHGAGYIMLPHIDFYLRSFTIELWIYLTNTTLSNFALFAECSTDLDVYDPNSCLHIAVSSNATMLRFGFWFDDIDSSSILDTYHWYHLAFVYDYNSRTRSIYLDGIFQNSIATNPNASHLYLGQSNNVNIGRMNFHDDFVGSIDHVSITYRAKTAEEILNDATLVAYYSFDCGFTFDSGPNLLPVTGPSHIIVPGRINEGFQFDAPGAYLRTPQLAVLGITNASFSFSFWINPIRVLGTLLHLSTTLSNDEWCSTILGFSSSGNITTQVHGTVVSGPTFPVNVWTHVAYTYSVTNGIRLYVNGTLNKSSGGNIERKGPNTPVYLIVANQLAELGVCSSAAISPEPFNGAIDELRIYSREISSSDVCMLSSLI